MWHLRDVSNPILYLHPLLPIFLTDYSPWQRQLLDQIGVVLASAPFPLLCPLRFHSWRLPTQPVSASGERSEIKMEGKNSFREYTIRKEIFILSFGKYLFKLKGLKLPVTVNEEVFFYAYRLSYQVFITNVHLYLNKVNMFISWKKSTTGWLRYGLSVIAAAIGLIVP